MGSIVSFSRVRSRASSNCDGDGGGRLEKCKTKFGDFLRSEPLLLHRHSATRHPSPRAFTIADVYVFRDVHAAGNCCDSGSSVFFYFSQYNHRIPQIPSLRHSVRRVSLMHRIFDIPEVVELILLHNVLSTRDLYHFGITRSTHWVIAAPILWGKATVTLRILGALLPPRFVFPRGIKYGACPLLVLPCVYVLNDLAHQELPLRLRHRPPLSDEEWRPIKHYAHFVRAVSFDQSDFPGCFETSFHFLTAFAPVFRDWPTPYPMFPKLRSIQLFGASTSPQGTALLEHIVGPRIESLAIFIDYRVKPPDDSIHPPLLRNAESTQVQAAHICAAVQACSKLRKLLLYIRDVDLCRALSSSLPPLFARSSHLERLDVTFTPEVGFDGSCLHALAALPRLYYVDLSQILLFPLSTPLPTTSFPALENLTITVFRAWYTAVPDLSPLLSWIWPRGLENTNIQFSMMWATKMTIIGGIMRAPGFLRGS